MKRAVIIILALAIVMLFATLGGCSKALPPDEGTEGAGTAQAISDEERQIMMKAYSGALLTLLNDGVDPNGDPHDYQQGMPDGNKFAVYDVDRDGRPELLIEYTTSSMAGMFFGIYDYDFDSGRCVEELVCYPSMIIYDNGVITADESHNHSLAENFWPYTVYRYDAENDKCIIDVSVSAWEKEYTETDYNGQYYPDAIDVSGTGMVYYIEKENDAEGLPPVDVSEYEAWRQSNINGNEVDISFNVINEDNAFSVRNL